MRKLLLALVLMLSAATAAEKITDVEFARPGGYSLTMDISIPEGLGPHAVVILVHGGGWENGDKESFIQPWFPVLTRASLAWVSINYRLAPQFKYPAAVEDVETAVQFIRTNGNKYRLDGSRIALMGESAGGHLVALVAGRANVKVRGVVDFYGPSNLVSLTEHRKQLSRNMQNFLGITEMNESTKKLMFEASPVTYVVRRMPPFLFVHGDADVTVPVSQSREMCDRMKEVKAKCEVFVVPGAAHGVTNWEKNESLQAYKEKMVDWLTELLK